MNCPSCGAQNVPGSRFCTNCGQALGASCPGCATLNPAGARFCNNCGQRLEAQPAQPAPAAVPPSSTGLEGERRVVTILFCDVSGSTALAGEMDPEEWTEIMNLAFKRLIEPVYRYEGTVARLMGDSILAFFGAPVAHEDDPQRAILAGLEILESIQPFRRQMREARGLDFNVRVGINTGLVVVGKVGAAQMNEYTAMGDAANLAARMEQTAQPGTLQIAEDTYRVVQGLFVFDPLGEIEIKGKKDRVRSYRVLSKIPGKLPSRGIQGLRSAMIGRETELTQIQSRLQTLANNQTGGLVSVIGEAGLGKSRLVAEVHHWLTRQGLIAIDGGSAPLAWFEARTLSYQTHTPYAPFQDLLRKMMGAQPGTELDYTQVRSEVARNCPNPETIAPFLASLLGIEISADDSDRVKYLDPPKLRGQIHLALQAWLDCFTAHQPMVLVFEDLHWTDEASIGLLEHLLAPVAGMPLVCLFLFRPNTQDHSWAFHERLLDEVPGRYTPLFLHPLDDTQARVLVGNLLEIEDLPENVRALILQKADGNPFFVEEVIRSLLDNGLVVRKDDHWIATREIAQITLPDTLAGIITARLDRLDEATRRVTQEAAVIGREFAYLVLQAVHDPQPGNALDASLALLRERDLVREKADGQHRLFSFKHALTQETAYQSVLLSRRRSLHLRAAEYFESSDPGQSGEIARHFLEAGQARRALPYLVTAGRQAQRTYANQEAIRYFRQAIQALSQAPDVSLGRQAYEGLGHTLTMANQVEEAIAVFKEMRVFGEAQADISSQVSALNKLSELLSQRLGQVSEADAILQNAEKMARAEDDLPGLAEMFMIRCGLCMSTGDFNGAIDYLEESVQINRSLSQPDHAALGLVHIANTQIYMTEFDRAWDTAQEGMRLAQETGNLEIQAELLSEVIPYAYLHRGDHQAAYEAALQGAGIGVQIGSSLPESMGLYIAGRIAFDRGDYEEALDLHKRAAEAGRSFGMPFLTVLGLCAVGSVYLSLSSSYREQIFEAHHQAIEMLEQPGGNIGGGFAWLDLGLCLTALGDLTEAERYLKMGLTVPTSLMLITRPLHQAALAQVHILRGELAEARDLLDQACQFTEEKQLQEVYPTLRMALGRLCLAQSDFAAAVVQFDQAAGLAKASGLRPILWQAHADAAQALVRAGESEAARSRLDQARVVIEEIAAKITNPEYRDAYLIQINPKLAASQSFYANP